MIYTLIHTNSENTVDAIFSFDSISSASESWSGTVSKHTVEYGFPISSHINIENPTFDLSLKLSAFSVFRAGSELKWTGSDFKTVGEDDGFAHINAKDTLTRFFKQRYVFTLLVSESNSFDQDINNRLDELKSSYYTEYNNCVMTGLTFDQSNGMSQAFNVSVKLEQLNVAKVVFTQLTNEEKQRRIIPVKPKQASSSVGKATSSKDDEANSGLPEDTAKKASDGVSNKPKEPQWVTDKKANNAADIAKLKSINTAIETTGSRAKWRDNGSGSVYRQDEGWEW